VAEDEARRREAGAAVEERGPVLGDRGIADPGRRARLLAIGLIGLLDGGIAQVADQPLRIESRHLRRHLGEGGLLVEQVKRREPRHANGAQHAALGRLALEPGGLDRPAHPPRRHEPLARGREERHAEGLGEPPPAVDARRGRRAAPLEVRGVLAQPDRDEPPRQTVAVAPFERAHERLGRIRPGAARIRVVDDLDLRRHLAKPRCANAGWRRRRQDRRRRAAVVPTDPVGVPPPGSRGDHTGFSNNRESSPAGVIVVT
jgi:hypothetical protein